MVGGDVFAPGLSTLPLRGRVGAQRWGGVTFSDIPRITPTRSFAATSPLKGAVKRDRGGYENPSSQHRFPSVLVHSR